MRPYRVFFKDCLKLNEMAKGEVVCLSFNIERDALETATSSFTVKSVPDNVNEGDVLGLVDPYGTILYLGVINSIDERVINTSQIESLFNDNWLYWSPSTSTIETAIMSIIETDFKGSDDPIMSSKYNFTLITETSTSGSLISEDQVINFEQFIYEMFNSFGVRLYFDIPYSSGTPKITIANRTYETMKIGNNVQAITSFTPTTSVQELNKLKIYSSENVYRGTWYMTPNGATDDEEDPNRLPVVNTQFVFSDDPIDDIVAEYFSTEMYNHYIEFQMLLDNKLYDFYSMELGTPLQIFLNEDYYESIYTGYSLSKEENGGLDYAIMKCGKVRVALTSKLLGVLK